MGDDPGSDSRLTDGKSCVPTARRSIFLGGHVGPNTGICPSGEGTGEQKWVAGGPPSLVTALGDTSRMRSEEHTSELKSLMRISYAALCLKKKTSERRNSVR